MSRRWDHSATAPAWRFLASPAGQLVPNRAHQLHTCRQPQRLNCITNSYSVSLRRAHSSGSDIICWYRCAASPTAPQGGSTEPRTGPCSQSHFRRPQRESLPPCTSALRFLNTSAAVLTRTKKEGGPNSTTDFCCSLCNPSIPLLHLPITLSLFSLFTRPLLQKVRPLRRAPPSCRPKLNPPPALLTKPPSPHGITPSSPVHQFIFFFSDIALSPGLFFLPHF